MREQFCQTSIRGSENITTAQIRSNLFFKGELDLIEKLQVKLCIVCVKVMMIHMLSGLIKLSIKCCSSIVLIAMVDSWGEGDGDLLKSTRY